MMRDNSKVDWSGREDYYDNDGTLHEREPIRDIVEDLMDKGMSFEALDLHGEER
jgi:hypothetical protein